MRGFPALCAVRHLRRLIGSVVVQHRVIGARLRAHTLRARFLSCIDSRSQRSAERIILLPISEGPDVFIRFFRIQRMLSPSSHDVLPRYAAEERCFYGGPATPRRSSSCLNGGSFAADAPTDVYENGTVAMLSSRNRAARLKEKAAQ